MPRSKREFSLFWCYKNGPLFHQTLSLQPSAVSIASTTLSFNWKIIALQRRAGFCWTTTGISNNYMYNHLPFEPLSPSRLSWDARQHSLYCIVAIIFIILSLIIIFTHGSVYMSMLFSQCVLPSPSSTVSTSSFSAPSFLPCKWVHQCYFSRFHKYPWIYICSSLSDFTLYNSLWVHPLHTTDSNLFLLWLIVHCIYVAHLHPFICWWASRSLPCPGYVSSAALNIGVLFELWFSQGICPVVALPGHIVVLFLFFLRNLHEKWKWLSRVQLFVTQRV